MITQMTTIHAEIESISPLTDSILSLILNPEHYVQYEAGQYLQILSRGQPYPFSIANAPLGSHKYELHIRHSPENAAIDTMLSDMREEGSVNIRLPFGHCHLKTLHPDKPILLIAAGTGFAPIKAIIEQLLASGDQRQIALFWGARDQSDLYLDEKVIQWQNHVGHFRYHTLLSNVSQESLSSMVLAHHQKDLSDWQIVISGPFDRVYQTRDLLLAQGAKPEYLFSDAFYFENQE